MKIKTYLLFVLCISLSFLAGCQSATTDGNNTAANAPGSKPAAAAVNSPAAKTADSSTAKKEMDSIDLSDIDAGSAMPASSLNEKFSLMPGDWKGQKVAVTGLYKSHSTSEGVSAASAYRTDLKDKDTKTAVGCFSKSRPALWDDVQKNYQKYEKDRITVKGVVAGTVDYGDGAFVGLEPCEIVIK